MTSTSGDPLRAPPHLPGLAHMELVGQGGSGSVYRALQAALERPVAVKVFSAPISSDFDRSQFDREIRLHGRLSQHPYVVSVFDGGISQDGHPYIVMEYYPGGTIVERARSEPFALDKALSTSIHIASALRFAHSHQIFHLDVKPTNILFSSFDQPGLTDFGVAAVSGDRAPGFTLAYAAPEVISGGAGSSKSDSYGLAATLYFIASGRAPRDISGESLSTVVERALVDRPDLSKVRRDFAPLKGVLRDALAIDPADRPSITELSAQLLSIEADLGLAPTAIDIEQGGRFSPADLAEPELDYGSTITRREFALEIGPLRSARLSVPENPGFSVAAKPIQDIGELTIGRASAAQAIAIQQRKVRLASRWIGVLGALSSVATVLGTLASTAATSSVAIGLVVSILGSLAAAAGVGNVSAALARSRRTRTSSRSARITNLAARMQLAYVEALAEEHRQSRARRNRLALSEDTW